MSASRWIVVGCWVVLSMPAGLGLAQEEEPSVFGPDDPTWEELSQEMRDLAIQRRYIGPPEEKPREPSFEGHSLGLGDVPIESIWPGDPEPEDPFEPPDPYAAIHAYHPGESVEPGEVVEPEPELLLDPADALRTDPTSRLYSYGEPATVRCAPHLACSIDLEPGERIRGRVIGDPDRWDYTEIFSGPEGAERPHVVVRPTDYGIHTNLMIATDRRAYRLRLVAVEYPADPEAEEVAFTERVAFRYPERWAATKPLPPTAAASLPSAEPAVPSGTAKPQTRPVEEAEPGLEPASLESVNFGYRIVQPRRKRHRFDWKPLAVFDDGVRTYVHLPPLWAMDVAPVISGIQPTGDPYPLNATLHGNVYVIPRLFKAAELYLGVGKKRRWLRIERLPGEAWR